MFSYLNKYLTIINYIRSNYYSKELTSLDIELTTRCNLKCKMCWFHGENGVGNLYQNSEMATEDILELISQLHPYRPHIYFGGGEPFIREDFPIIMAHVKSFDLPISLTTNGTLLDKKKIQNIVDLEIDEINFSIDGTEEVHDELRGQGNFVKAMSSIQHLLACKKDKNLRKPLITINITVNPLVVGHLKETIDLIRKTTGDEIDFFRIHHLWFITPAELQVHKAAIRKTLEKSANGARAHCISSYQHIDSTTLSNEISMLKNEDKMKFFPDLQEEEITAFYSESYRLSKRCVAPFHTVLVKPNGDLKFCPDEWIDDYVLGNIRDDSFENIWNGRNARQFRSIILRKKSFSGCKRCSWMHC